MKKKFQIICVGFITLNFQLITHHSLSQNVGINADGSNPQSNTILDIKGTDNTSSSFGLKVKNSSGTDQFVVRNDGNVGVGLSTPTTNFQVSTDAIGISGRLKTSSGYTGLSFRDETDAETGFLYWFGTTFGSPRQNRLELATNGASDIAFITNNAFNLPKMLIESGGNVGIGTTTTSSLLHVNGDIEITQAAGALRSTGTLRLDGDYDGAGSGNIAFRTDGQQERMVIRQTGLVGIGDQGPDAQLEVSVSGGTVDLLMLSTDDANDGDIMVVKNNGDVGIGTTTPGDRLAISQANAGGDVAIQINNTDGVTNTASTASLYLGATTGSANAARIVSDFTGTAGADHRQDLLFYYVNGGSVPTEGMRINNAGNVGIGTTAPTALLSVNGAANNTTGVWGVFSDERIKTVNGEFTDGLNVVRNINPIRFNYKENAPFFSDQEQIGVIAQELEKIAPYMVSISNNSEIEDLREINPQAYIYLLINAIKEQQLIIESQQDQIKEQKEEVGTLRSDMFHLKKQFALMEEHLKIANK